MTTVSKQQGKATLIVDLQFGSTGKGLIAGLIAERDQPDVVVCAFSANAGHTYINAAGRKYVHCALPNGVVSPKLKFALIGPGAQFNLKQLMCEALDCADHLNGAQVLIHPHATIIQQHHIDAEAGPMTKIGSTKKGCGAALIEKIQRNPATNVVACDFTHSIAIMAADLGVPVRVCTASEYEAVLQNAEQILVEGAQGYSLGMNSGFYPYVTSRECTPAQLASDCLLPLSMIGKVIGTMRTYPIRVANRYDEEGNMVGWSGPCYSDQTETTFEELGQETELTTVTKLPRRIFTFSREQTERALWQCRPDEIFLNFANYASDELLQEILETVDNAAMGLGLGGIRYIGWGPKVTDVVDVSELCEEAAQLNAVVNAAAVGDIAASDLDAALDAAFEAQDLRSAN